MRNIRCITGAGRGMGIHLVRTADAAGNALIATGITKEMGQ
jgi:hypothetical protein